MMSAVPDPDELKRRVFAAIGTSLHPDGQAMTDDTPLLGDGGLDSMKLVELCLKLEDLATENGFEFNWTSDTAMSRLRSMFRSAGALAQEFVAQSGGRG
jgi:acyl carrier protein